MNSVITDERGKRRLGSTKPLSFSGFLRRYPILLLAFGPPIFRAGAGINATKGIVDYWAFIQAGWISVLALRAAVRLVYAKSIYISKQNQSILRLSFFLGALFMLSAIYSPNHLVSFAYSFLYFLTWICVVEFVVDVRKNPPDWIHFILQLRMITLLLFGIVILTSFINPTIVMTVIPDVGIRLGGGAVAPITVICPMMAIISAYTILYSLESRVISIFYFLVGMTGTVITQSRGCELALFLSLSILTFVRAGTGKRSAYIFLSGFSAAVLFSGIILAYVGGWRLWNLFNRGQSMVDIESASGRVNVWEFIVNYCILHPQGMGYISGFRSIFRSYFALGLEFDVAHIGTAHNSFLQVLADAGWLAFSIYIIMIYKILTIGLHYARRSLLVVSISEVSTLHAIRCALILLIFCMAAGMNTAEFVLPLRAVFYIQFIIISVILASSAELMALARKPTGQP